MTMAGRIGVMDEGRILQIGSPTAVYETPNCRFTAEFIGSVNLFEGVVTEDEPDYVVISSPGLERGFYISHGITGTLDMRVWVALRPEKISVSREPPEAQYNWLKGRVRDIAYLGSHSIYYVEIPGGRMVSAVVSNLQRLCEDCPTWKDEVCLSWASNSAVVLTQ